MSGGFKKDETELVTRFPELAVTGEARKSLAWFLYKVRCNGEIDHDWAACTERMRRLNAGEGVLRVLPVDHDFWLCKRANPKPRPDNFILSSAPDYKSWSTQLWQPPSSWTFWPTFDIENEDWLAASNARSTRSLDDASLNRWRGDAQADRLRAMMVFRTIERNVSVIDDHVVLTQCVAWVDAALGRLGRLFWFDDEDIPTTFLIEDLVINVLSHRLNRDGHSIEDLTGCIEDLTQFNDESIYYPDMMEDCLEKLYGSVQSFDGSLLIAQSCPRGQSREWRDFFRALGHNLSTEQVLASVQLSALLLRSESIWSALEILSEGGGRQTKGLIELATCVRRRWYLTLRALSWLEDSLIRSRNFEILQPADLVYFAITSLLPVYPRPQMAISHRSSDVKEQLLNNKIWLSNEVLIDAAFRPEWQTNRAMVWSLFASTPVLCKVLSPNYKDSDWCRRESEMFNHLAMSTDFMEGRWVVEVEIGGIKGAESLVRSSLATNRFFDMAAGLESPPFEIRQWHFWQGVMVRASAIARFVHRLFIMGADGQTRLLASHVNDVLKMLYSEKSVLPEETFLGFDNFWHRLSEGLRADAELINPEGRFPDFEAPFVTILEDAEISTLQVNAWYERHLPTLPLLPANDLDLCDLLAALEWRDHLEDILRGHNKGTQFEYQANFIDLRGVTEEEWGFDPGWTVARALVHLRLPYPLLVRQLADQGVENWLSIREADTPIFTQHHSSQVIPNNEVFFSLGGPWPAVFFNRVSDTVQMSPYLVFACQESLKHGSDPVYMRSDIGLKGLSLPGSDFEDWLRRQGEGEDQENTEREDE